MNCCGGIDISTLMLMMCMGGGKDCCCGGNNCGGCNTGCGCDLGSINICDLVMMSTLMNCFGGCKKQCC